MTLVCHSKTPCRKGAMDSICIGENEKRLLDWLKHDTISAKLGLDFLVDHIS